MGTILLIDDTYKAPATTISEVKSLALFDTQVLALQDLIYGPSQTPQGISPAHDHQEDGGENLARPILSHSFGQFRTDWTTGHFTVRGLPIGVPRTTNDPATQKTFEPVVTNGFSDPSGAKKMFGTVVMVPGGCLGVRVSLLMANTNGGTAVTLAGIFRHLQDVNYKLGNSPTEARADITVTRSGAGADKVYEFYADIADLSQLGDPKLDRELDFSLWLTSDDGFNFFDDLITHVEITPYYFTSQLRSARADDKPQPRLAVREVQKNKGVFSPVLGDKLKKIWNNLAVSLLGASPGLQSNGQPDQTRRYMEILDDCHRHQGIAVPDIDGTVFSDGAVLADYQSFGYIQTLGGDDPTSSDVHLNSDPVVGRVLHSSATLASGWTQFNFRRSIPSGLGALLMRFGIMPNSLTRTATLLVRVTISPAGETSNIVTRTQCGQYLSEDDSSDTDYQYVELVPRADPGYVNNRLLLRANLKGWNRGAEIASNLQTAQGMSSKLVRISEPLIVKLTYPPLQPLDPRHKTGDYDVKVRFKLRLTPGGTVYDSGAACQFISCWSMPGF
jgi:hypothetical protein